MCTGHAAGIRVGPGCSGEGTVAWCCTATYTFIVSQRVEDRALLTCMRTPCLRQHGFCISHYSAGMHAYEDGWWYIVPLHDLVACASRRRRPLRLPHCLIRVPWRLHARTPACIGRACLQHAAVAADELHSLLQAAGGRGRGAHGDGDRDAPVTALSVRMAQVAPAEWDALIK